ncbi:MAG: hypothetical protein AAFP07_02855 [Cyanobacteria bacterium J06606_4]
MGAFINEIQDVGVDVSATVTGAFSTTDASDSFSTGDALPEGDNDISTGLGPLNFERALTNLSDAFTPGDEDMFPDVILGGGLSAESTETVLESVGEPFLPSGKSAAAADISPGYVLGASNGLDSDISEFQNEMSAFQNSLESFFDDIEGFFNITFF